ncbi:hypothetical protein T4D_15053 [Trichinella pseudospiralis]|uniref:Uncharacterized protein n=1 Tax=Trichinella pseudospiralis TaxID=6337 RepID=A0A0V1G032_TRIPS|nr:hypothetical protein T4D_15053 [Trichinella pseudospiralis]
MEFFKRSIAENMIPFKDSNGGKDDALSLVLTTLQLRDNVFLHWGEYEFLQILKNTLSIVVLEIFYPKFAYGCLNFYHFKQILKSCATQDSVQC